MVNTRRMESIGSSPDIRTRHRTRQAVKEEVSVTESSSVNESDSDESNADQDASSNDNAPLVPRKVPIKKKEPPPLPPPRQRPLSSRFGQRKFASRSLRSSRKHLSLNEHRTLTVYSSRKMDCDSDFDNGNDSEEDLYSRRRKPRHNMRMSRMERRTALSLRPISQKCYADPHSPLHFNSDSEGAGVRRSKRKRVQFNNSSWLTDDQMHKVGYPNLNVGYSEEDSRDAQEGQWQSSNQRMTRNGLREVKNPKYLYDYQTVELPPRRRRVSSSVRNDRELRSSRDLNGKENKQENIVNGRANGRVRETKQDSNKEESGDCGEQSNPSAKETEETSKSEEINGETEVKEEVDDKNEESSESEDEDLPRLRRTRNSNNNRMLQNNFSPRRTRNKKIMESSSESEEEGRKYSLRDRVPKPAPKEIQTRVLRETFRNRRRFNRRRNASESSSSSSNSSDDVRHSKPPKSPHSKNEKMKSGAGSAKIIPIGPETLDSKVRFNSIGGLDSHVQCLKEMILLPMMYPEVFNQFQIQPPRGVLFHGPPGTGKTLIARALANECSFGKRKVSFFLRKGADLLSKWIGESEKQLRLLFEQAAEMKPSIIFFDELDGLAPVRSSRQDQVHASIVSTLLALMDGLDNRGEVIIIGATNRIDAIDPALRRPGRFDRELFFPLPSRKDREEILNVHVSQWTNPPSRQMLSYLAEHSVGYCGSDLRALCSEAVIQSFRRTYPQVYDSEYRLLLNPENVKVEKVDFMRAKSVLIPASHRQTQGLGRKLLPSLDPLLAEPLKKAFESLDQTFPHGSNIALAKVKLSPNVRPAQLLITAAGPEHGQTCHLAPAILYKMEHIHAYLLDLATLFQETGRSPEETVIQIFNEARRNIPSVIYLPSISQWWELVSETVKAILVMQISKVDPNIPILFLATADSPYASLPSELQNMFSIYRKEVCEIDPPNKEARIAFFRPLVVESSLRPLRNERQRPKTPSPLPRAPTPLAAPLSEEQAKKLYETEEHTLRELRIFLRDICKKLANNKLFFMFTKPVDTEEVPDYTTIIKQPMDLETMMTKVDFHRYECAKDFLTDIELICQNALEYNPARTSADKQIRHRACSLRDYAYTLIKNEMDTDFEDKCQTISKKRRERKACTQKYLPPYIHTPELNFAAEVPAEEPTTETLEKPPTVDVVDEKATPSRVSHSPHRKRKFSWQKGCLRRKKRQRAVAEHLDETVSTNASLLECSTNTKDLSQTVEKSLVGDESKENNPDISTNDVSVKAEDVAETRRTSQNANSNTTPLTINCDTQSIKMELSSPLQSPRRRLSNLLSPSELLDNPLDFDDVDQALNEKEEEDSNTIPIECSVADLERVLEQIAKATSGFSLMSLLDLHNQLNRIIKKYSRTHNRSLLPKELAKELIRFKKERLELNDSSNSTDSNTNVQT